MSENGIPMFVIKKLLSLLHVVGGKSNYGDKNQWLLFRNSILNIIFIQRICAH